MADTAELDPVKYEMFLHRQGGGERRVPRGRLPLRDFGLEG